MTAYVLSYLTYDSSNKQKPLIQSINTELIDPSLSNIEEELVTISANWIRDEIGKNNYQETLCDIRSINELPDGLIRRYSNTETDKKDISSEINRQINGNVIKQINIFRKTTMAGTLYGKWSDLELIRSYFISTANCQNFGYSTTTSSHKTIESIGQSAGYDDVITQLKNFSRVNLRSLAKRLEEAPVENNYFKDAFESESESNDEDSTSSDDSSSSSGEEESSEWDSDEEAANSYEIVPSKIPPPPPLPVVTEEQKALKKIL